jgi:hypothetical protein
MFLKLIKSEYEVMKLFTLRPEKCGAVGAAKLKTEVTKMCGLAWPFTHLR